MVEAQSVSNMDRILVTRGASLRLTAEPSMYLSERGEMCLAQQKRAYLGKNTEETLSRYTQAPSREFECFDCT